MKKKLPIKQNPQNQANHHLKTEIRTKYWGEKMEILK